MTDLKVKETFNTLLFFAIWGSVDGQKKKVLQINKRMRYKRKQVRHEKAVHRKYKFPMN